MEIRIASLFAVNLYIWLVLSMKGKVKANFQKSDRLEQKDEHTQISTKID